VFLPRQRQAAPGRRQIKRQFVQSLVSTTSGMQCSEQRGGDDRVRYISGGQQRLAKHSRQRGGGAQVQRRSAERFGQQQGVPAKVSHFRPQQFGRGLPRVRRDVGVPRYEWRCAGTQQFDGFIGRGRCR
jgi:hypothetical protein